MHITIINPNNVTQKGDFFGTGIPYMPIIPAYLAAYLTKQNHSVQVIDAFGENTSQKRVIGEFIIRGLTIYEIVAKIKPETNLICLYAGHVVEHNVLIEIIKEIKLKFNCPIAIIENSQAVTSYSLLRVKELFFKEGADFIVYGEPEITVGELIENLNKKSFSKINGLIYKEKKTHLISVNPRREQIHNLDILPFPAWDLFPVQNYWNLGYSHAPFIGKYMPLLTSRGCVYSCRFCIIPQVNQKKWYARSAKNVFDEMLFLQNNYNIKDFHIEDLNSTIDKKRIQELCNLIISNNLNVTLKFASGIKIETLDEETLLLLKKAGCSYISFSPESGSTNVLNLMNKPFNHDYGIKMLKSMHKLGITTQACFILGFPGENQEDIRMTQKYLFKLFRNGLNETAILIMTPVPGSEPYEVLQMSLEDLSKLTFSPKWRENYTYLNRIRMKMYIYAYLIKMTYHPIDFCSSIAGLITHKFKTKVEMTLYRLFKTYRL